jgi:hypothetical protein
MLGFTAFSEAPISQATTSAISLAYLSTVGATIIAESVLYDAQAFITNPSATSSFTANPLLFDAQALGSISGTTSATAINDVLYDAKAGITLSAATASFTAGALDFNELAYITITSAIADILNGGIEFDAKANTSVSNVAATITAYDFEDVYGKANAALSSTSAYLTIYIGDFADEYAQARAFIPPAVATIQALDVEYDAKAFITTSAVTTAIATSDLDYDAQARYYITTLLATFDQALDEPISVTTDYQQYADSYERNRTLYIVSDVKGHTVHIPERESTTIYLGAQDTNRTVNIAA